MDRETIALVFTALMLFFGTKLVSKFATWATRNVNRTETAYYVLGSGIVWGVLLLGILMISSCASTGSRPSTDSVLVSNEAMEPLTIRANGMRIGWVQPGSTECFSYHSSSTVTFTAEGISSRIAGPTVNNGSSYQWRITGLRDNDALDLMPSENCKGGQDAFDGT